MRLFRHDGRNCSDCVWLVFWKAEGKDIHVKVVAYREKKRNDHFFRTCVAVTEFVFVSICDIDSEQLQKKPDYLPYVDHGLKYLAQGYEDRAT